MNPLRTLVAIGLVAFLAPCLADDSAAAIAAGGLIPRRETRIVMAKEVLTISTRKVVVDYDFRNDSSEDVTTEVAFPVPPFDHGPTSAPPDKEPFADFRLTIDGRPFAFQVEAKATLNGKDVTGILTADKIDVASFGHLVESPSNSGANWVPDFSRLPSAEKKRLISLGLISVSQDGTDANWTVSLQYHWTQHFPAYHVVHIRHEYTPEIGFEGVFRDELAAEKQSTGSSSGKKWAYRERPDSALQTFCAEPDLQRALAKGLDLVAAQEGDKAERNGVELNRSWVDFILTTANTWKQPIEDFTLIVERPKDDGKWKQLVSFCSPTDARVEKIDPEHFRVHLTNFIPKAELHIGFFDTPLTPKPATATNKKQ